MLTRDCDRADSITFDPHKWLFQPFEIGCVLVRDLRHLRQAFTVHDDDHGEYLEDVSRIAGRDRLLRPRGAARRDRSGRSSCG